MPCPYCAAPTTTDAAPHDGVGLPYVPLQRLPPNLQ